MKKIIYKSEDRGVAEHGWLHSKFSFSFADYYNPDKMGFGLLRVLNDDTVEPGMGFQTHTHNNMEIISVVKEGTLAHKDSMGSITTLIPGEVQVMSAGTGILHSEYNHSDNEILKFLQIWIFPKERNIKPQYEQKYFDFDGKENYITEVVSGSKNNDTLYIHQEASLSLGKLDKGKSKEYKIKHKGNGAFLFLLEGKIEAEEVAMKRRDALGIYDTESFFLSAEENSEFIIIEVTMS